MERAEEADDQQFPATSVATNPIQTVELDSAASSRSPKMIGFFLFARPIWDVFSVLLKLWDSIHGFGPETRFHSWIWTVYHLH